MGWESLITVTREAAQLAAAEAARPEVACPNDGEPLQQGPRGEWFCRYDGYRPGGGDQ